MPLGRYLLEGGLIDSGQLSEARAHRKIAGGTLDDSLVSLGHLQREFVDSFLELHIPVPESVAETRLDSRFLTDFLLRTIYVHGFETSQQISKFVCLSIYVVDELLGELKEKRLVEILGLTQDSLAAYRYNLTDTGRHWAAEALERCQYTGPAPVQLDDYQLQIEKQSILREQIDRTKLHGALSHLVLAPEVIDRLGPALSAASGVLLYGPPGNGKTSIAEALGNTFQQHVLIPHCICVDGQIVKVFDPASHVPVCEQDARPSSDLSEEGLAEVDGSHEPVDELPESEPDLRWVRCQRPVVITAGELNMEMLDLRFDTVAKFYEAPAHVKAMGGVFVIDDFGRQRVDPQELVNRWIMPLEARVDLLTLHNGKKIEMPFDQLVVFSTNFQPDKLMDPAGLRRIPYKFYLDAPTAEDYAEILRRVAKARDIVVPEDVLSYLLDDFYPSTGSTLSAAHPAFLIDHAVQRCRFDGREVALTVEVVREATENLTLRV
jgi:predicted ATPase with chaperone activity